MTTRVPTGKPRGRPKGSPKTGGRVAKSLDRSERMLVTSQMAGDILSVYERLGGADFLYRWAKANQNLYVTNVLQKLMPAAPKDDADFVQNNTLINFNDPKNLFESARSIAFALASGLNAQQELSELAPIMAECVPGTSEPMTPQEACRADTSDPLPPTYEPAGAPPTRAGFVYDAKDARPYDVQFHAWDLCRNTKDNDISTYHGSPAEQGGGYQQPVVNTKASAGELCRKLSRRGRDLL